MAKKTKSVFNESFAQGMGSEMGKKTGVIIFGLIIVFLLFVFGIKIDNSSKPEQSKPIKIVGTNGNIE